MAEATPTCSDTYDNAEPSSHAFELFSQAQRSSDRRRNQEAQEHRGAMVKGVEYIHSCFSYCLKADTEDLADEAVSKKDIPAQTIGPDNGAMYN